MKEGKGQVRRVRNKKMPKNNETQLSSAWLDFQKFSFMGNSTILK